MDVLLSYKYAISYTDVFNEGDGRGRGGHYVSETNWQYRYPVTAGWPGIGDRRMPINPAHCTLMDPSASVCLMS